MLIRQKQSKKPVAGLMVIIAACLPALAQIPMATEGISRQGRMEFYGIGQYLNSEDIDSDTFHSTSTNTGRFTIPAGLDGFYLIGGHIMYAASAQAISPGATS